jgi:epoxyqueuosine reductase
MSLKDDKHTQSMRKTKHRTGVIRKILEENGVCCTGFADISRLGLPITHRFPFGICFGIHYDDEIVNQLPNDVQWSKMASSLTEKATQIYRVVQEQIESWGYHHSRIPSTTRIDVLPDPGEELPQKTLATLAGMGWIGKSTLLINPKFGPRIRLGALLTDIPIETSTPITQSKCGDCRACVDVCPVHAIKGNLWSQGTPRNELFDVSRCYDYRWSKKETLGRRLECGICLKACPITIKKQT